MAGRILIDNELFRWRGFSAGSCLSGPKIYGLDLIGFDEYRERCDSAEGFADENFVTEVVRAVPMPFPVGPKLPLKPANRGDKEVIQILGVAGRLRPIGVGP